jgi:hypothetical protein
VNVTVHIERLVIDGFAVEPRALAELRTAVTAEIARLLATGPVPAALLANSAVASVRAPGVVPAPATAGAGTTPGSVAAWGTQIGRAVHRSFGP